MAASAGAGAENHERHEPKGEPIIGERSVWWTVAGLLIGSAIGWFLGLSFGYGQWSVPGLAPLVASGAGPIGFVSDSLFGSLLALAGAILGTASEARQSARERRPHGRRHQTPVIHRLPIYGSIALALFMA